MIAHEVLDFDPVGGFGWWSKGVFFFASGLLRGELGLDRLVGISRMVGNRT